MAKIHFMQEEVIRLIFNLVFISKVSTFADSRAVGDLTVLHRYFHGFCYAELASILPPLVTPQTNIRFLRSCTPSLFNNVRNVELPISFISSTIECQDFGNDCLLLQFRIKELRFF